MENQEVFNQKKQKILAIGIQNLPNQIDSYDLSNTPNINLTDYDIAFVDLSIIQKNPDLYEKLNKILNPETINEFIKSGGKLYILSIGNSRLFSKEKEFNPYEFLPQSIKIKTQTEPNTILGIRKYQEYFRLLPEITFYFMAGLQRKFRSNDLGCKLNTIALSRTNKKLGLELINFYDFHNYTKYSGKIIFLPTLGENSNTAVKLILRTTENIHLEETPVIKEEPKKQETFQLKEETDDPSAPPEWLHVYPIKKIDRIKKEVVELKTEILQKEGILKSKEKRLESLEYFKQLLWKEGKELEEIVERALNLLGIKIDTTNQETNHKRFYYNKESFILEVKSSDSMPARWEDLSEVIAKIIKEKEQTGKEWKGLFVMNHYSRKMPENRRRAFDINVTKTAKLTNIKCLDTVKLFEILNDFINNNTNRIRAIEKILL